MGPWIFPWKTCEGQSLWLRSGAETQDSSCEVCSDVTIFSPLSVRFFPLVTKKKQCWAPSFNMNRKPCIRFLAISNTVGLQYARVIQTDYLWQAGLTEFCGILEFCGISGNSMVLLKTQCCRSSSGFNLGLIRLKSELINHTVKPLAFEQKVCITSCLDKEDFRR